MGLKRSGKYLKMITDKNRSRGKILLISPNRPRSGNERTASRIAEILRKQSFEVIRGNSEETSSIRDFLRKVKPDLMICIHAIRSGAFLDCDTRPPTILVLGGTDLNIYAKQDKRLELDVRRRCLNASAVVSFTKEMRLETFQTKRHFIIPQGVRLSYPNLEESRLVDKLYKDLSENGSKKILLLVAGLRPVKDVLYLVDHSEKVFSTRLKDFKLAIVGRDLNKTYAEQVRKHTKDMSCVQLVSKSVGLSHPVLCGLLRKCDALVNSSLSEGSSVAIAEAYAAGVLVLARDIPANRATLVQSASLLEDIVEDRVVADVDAKKSSFERVGCGVLYSSPEGFISALDAIFVSDKSISNTNSSSMHDAIVKDGPRVVKSLNAAEYRSWKALVETCISSQ